MHPCRWAKTASRSELGVMNEFKLAGRATPGHDAGRRLRRHGDGGGVDHRLQRVVLTVSDAVHTARREGLRTVIAQSEIARLRRPRSGDVSLAVVVRGEREPAQATRTSWWVRQHRWTASQEATWADRSCPPWPCSPGVVLTADDGARRDGMAVRWWCSRLGSDAWAGSDGGVDCRLGQARRRFAEHNIRSDAIRAAAPGSTLQSNADPTMPPSNQANSPTPAARVDDGTDSAIPQSDWWPSAFAVGRWRTSRTNSTRPTGSDLAVRRRWRGSGSAMRWPG